MSSFIQDNNSIDECIHESITVYHSNLHGDGVKTLKKINKNDIIFKEKPMCCLQSIPNRQDAICCSYCYRFIGNINIQLKILKKEIDRKQLVNDYINDVNGSNDSSEILSNVILPCQSNCGTLYCSEKCRDSHLIKSHKYLCTGNINDDDADSSCLVQFILHSIETNEIFLLVADVFARICCDIDDGLSVENALRPWQGYCRNRWEDVAKSNDTEQSPEEFADTLRTLTMESWELLCDAFDLKSKNLDTVLDEDFMSRTIGMFEQNNVGVRLTNPVLSYVKKLDDSSELIESILNDVKEISKILEEGGECEWEDVDDDANDDADDDADEVGNIDSLKLDEEVTSAGIFEKEPTNPKLIELQEILISDGVDNIFPPLDGTAFYKTICKINHSCCPNCIVKYTSDPVHGLLAQMVALRDIQEGEEMVQSYIDQSMDFKNRQNALRDYGFQCHCAKCTDEIK